MEIRFDPRAGKAPELPDPDVTPFTRWTYGDMERELSEVFDRLTAAGCEPSAAAAYAFGMISALNPPEGYERRRFTETLMAQTVYYSFVLARGIPVAGVFPARHWFEDYASLVETWGDRHYKGLELSAEDGDKLRTESYAVLSGLTKRSLDEEENGRTPPQKTELPDEQMMALTRLVMSEMERIKKEYTLEEAVYSPSPEDGKADEDTENTDVTDTEE